METLLNTHCMFTDVWPKKNKVCLFYSGCIHFQSKENVSVGDVFLLPLSRGQRVVLVIALQLIQSLCFEGGAIGQERCGGNQATPFLQERPVDLRHH